jgi:hypothetical protein
VSDSVPARHCLGVSVCNVAHNAFVVVPTRHCLGASYRNQPATCAKDVAVPVVCAVMKTAGAVCEQSPFGMDVLAYALSLMDEPTAQMYYTPLRSEIGHNVEVCTLSLNSGIWSQSAGWQSVTTC